MTSEIRFTANDSGSTKSYSDIIGFASEVQDEAGGMSNGEDVQKPAKGVTFVDDGRSSFSGRSRNKRPKLRTEQSLKRMIIERQSNFIFFPWNPWYRWWWIFSVSWSVLTVFFETHQIAFGSASTMTRFDESSLIVYLFTTIFAVDILINFNLAYFDEDDNVVYDRRKIARRYLALMFWVDLIGVFPFYIVLLALTGEMGQDSRRSQYLALVRLLRLVRLHRVKQLFDSLQYNRRISLMSLTMIRNFGAAIVWTHFAACGIYFIARQYDFADGKTWLGGEVYSLTIYERYITSMYWSIVTFTTVGYGDFSPVNVAEQIFGMIFMLCNMALAAWMIGSITLLIVKADEETSQYRDSLQALNEYSDIHGFERPFRKRLRRQLKLYFKGRALADEQVLKDFPVSVRRRVLKRLYLPTLYKTSLMSNIHQRFIDSFLTSCVVEVFSPGEEILARGSIATDLYLLVEGTVKLVSKLAMMNISDSRSKDDSTTGYTSTLGGSDEGEDLGIKTLHPGSFINDVSFFTETPQTDAVKTATVCKTLTMSQAAWKIIAQNHPGSVGKILHNLLLKVEEMTEEADGSFDITLSNSVSDLNESSYTSAGVIESSARQSDDNVEDDDNDTPEEEMQQTMASVQTHTAVIACQDLIRMHINKLRDDHITKFLFACSRGDTATISLMCDQGFDPNTGDYDGRTGLMVAAQSGRTDAVRTLSEYQANPNVIDKHGNSALYEAVKNNHEKAMDVLLEGGAHLGFKESEAASTLCQTVFDGDSQKLKHLIQAKIDVNAGDYDRRRAIHIAAAEGNLVALKILTESGTDVNVRDRWNNSVMDEAKASRNAQVIEFLKKYDVN